MGHYLGPVVKRLAMVHVFPVRANAGAKVKVTDDTGMDMVSGFSAYQG